MSSIPSGYVGNMSNGSNESWIENRMRYNGTNASLIDDDLAYYAWVRNEVFRYLYYIEIPLITALGVFGNGMSCVILRTKGQLKRLRSQPYLLAVALTSTLFLISIFLVWLEAVAPRTVNLYMRNRLGCKLITYIGSVADFACIWLIVAISIDRVFVVFCPLGRARPCSFRMGGRLPIFITLAIIALALVSNAWILHIAEVVPYGGCNIRPDYLDLWNTLTLFETVYSIIVPSVTVIITNLLVILKLMANRGSLRSSLTVTFSPNATVIRLLGGASGFGSRSTSARTSLTVTTQPINPLDPSLESTREALLNRPSLIRQLTNTSGILKPQEIRITKHLLVLTTTFVLLNIPHYIYRITVPHYLHKLWVLIILHLVYLFYYAHHGCLFYAYIFNSRRLRSELKPTALRLLECYCIKPVPEFGHSTLDGRA